MRIAGVEEDITIQKVLDQKRDFMKRNKYTHPTTLFLNQTEINKLNLDLRQLQGKGILNEIELKDGSMLFGLKIELVKKEE